MSSSTIFDNAQANASNWSNQADALMQKIQGIAESANAFSVSIPQVSAVQPTDWVSVSLLNKTISKGASTLPLALNLLGGVPPEALVLPDVTPIGELVIPEFNAVLPQLNLPATPAIQLPDSPGAAPEFHTPNLPATPVLRLPDAPVLRDILLPDAPLLEMPVFTATLAVQNLPEPSDHFAWAETPYTSALLDASKAALLRDMEEGGYGIERADELQLWHRERDREGAEAAIQLEEIGRRFVGRGFPFPPGAMTRALEQAHNTIMAASQSASRDIALKRADLYVQNRQFTIQQIKELESLLMNYHGAVMERALNAAKAIADFGVSLFNARVQRYNLELERYKTEAAVYGDQIRALVERTAVYRTQIEAAEAQGRLEMQKVEVYRSMVSAVETSANVYRTQVEAANVQASIERIRLDAYKSTIDCYSATVNAQQSQMQLYDARIKSELSKIQIFEAQAQAYSTQVSGLRAKADVLISKSRHDIDRNQSLIEGYKTQLAAYEAEQRVKAQRIEMQIKDDAHALEDYRTRVQAAIDSIRIRQADSELQLKQNESNAKLALDVARINAEVQRSGKELALSASRAGAEIYGQMISSAMGSINAIVSMSE